MLEQAGLIAAHHGVVLLVVQKHPHHRGLGYKGVYPPPHRLIARLIHGPGAEAGAVVVVDRQQAVGRPAGRRRVDRQIPAFGVPAQTQGAAPPPQGVGQVLRRRPLGGHRRLVAHVEVLFPPHQGAVRPPVGDKPGPVSGVDGEGGELLLRPCVQVAHPVQQHQAGEPGRPGQGPEEAEHLLPKLPPAPLRPRRPDAARRLPPLRRSPEGGALPVHQMVQRRVG